MDIMSPRDRSILMSRIKSVDTKPEKKIRKLLFGLGYRYRLHAKKLPGKPDIVFPGRRCVVFVHGCFWHRHTCGFAYQPKSRKEFWDAKFASNMNRDQRNLAELAALGWRTFIVWECEIDDRDLQRRLVGFLGAPSVITPSSSKIPDRAKR